MNLQENMTDFEMKQGEGMETYFTTKGLSGYLNIPEQTIRRWVLNNEIPYRRIHNVIRYRLSEIEAWIGEKKKNEQSGFVFDEGETGEATETAKDEAVIETADCREQE